MELGEILNYGWQLLQIMLSALQQFNAFLLTNFGGILLIVTAIVVAVAYKKITEVTRNQRTMERLADALIKQQRTSQDEED